MKAIVILVDGMRPDAAAQMEEAKLFMTNSAFTLKARTVMPSVTLPCHMSLFHSVDPARHGTTTNTYAPQVRPIRGLCEVLSEAKKQCAFFYNWEELRDLARPGSLAFSCFASGTRLGYPKTNQLVTDAAIRCISENKPDFAFLYLGFSDEAGHNHGWMSEPYLEAVKESWDCIRRVLSSLPEEYAVIITADHGGHDRSHGSDCPEDMTIPLFLSGKGISSQKDLSNADIKDIAPTVAALLGVCPDPDWEGKSLL